MHGIATSASVSSGYAADHAHVCPECDDRYPCGARANQCVDPESLPCPECSAAANYAVDCPTCGVYGPPVGTSDAAEQLAGVHDDMHHQGEPTADVHPA